MAAKQTRAHPTFRHKHYLVISAKAGIQSKQPTLPRVIPAKAGIQKPRPHTTLRQERSRAGYCPPFLFQAACVRAAHTQANVRKLKDAG